MNNQMWSRQVLLRYSLLQLPEVLMLFLILVLIKQIIYIPMWAVWASYSFLVIINIILFPFVWRAYDVNHSNAMCGSQGTVADSLSPYGYVRINGELWQAKVTEGNAHIEKGDVVKVTGMHGLTLIVQSERNEDTDLGQDNTVVMHIHPFTPVKHPVSF